MSRFVNFKNDIEKENRIHPFRYFQGVFASFQGCFYDKLYLLNFHLHVIMINLLVDK